MDILSLSRDINQLANEHKRDIWLKHLENIHLGPNSNCLWKTIKKITQLALKTENITISYVDIPCHSDSKFSIKFNKQFTHWVTNYLQGTWSKEFGTTLDISIKNPKLLRVHYNYAASIWTRQVSLTHKAKIQGVQKTLLYGSPEVHLMTHQDHIYFMLHYTMASTQQGLNRVLGKKPPWFTTPATGKTEDDL